MPTNFLQSLKIDSWFKALIYFGGVLALGASFIPTQIFDNENIFLFGLGLFLFGIGHWQHRLARVVHVNEPKPSVFVQFKRKFIGISIFGVTLQIAGVGLFFLVLEKSL